MTSTHPFPPTFLQLHEDAIQNLVLRAAMDTVHVTVIIFSPTTYSLFQYCQQRKTYIGLNVHENRLDYKQNYHFCSEDLSPYPEIFHAITAVLPCTCSSFLFSISITSPAPVVSLVVVQQANSELAYLKLPDFLASQRK